MLPAAPEALAAERRDTAVTIRFVVPGRNTDGSTPADLLKVDLYALDGPGTLSAADVVNRGRVVASVRVNPPQDPDATPDTPKPTVEGGVDQGAAAELADQITVAEGEQVRAYAAVGITRRGRRGAMSGVGFAAMTPAPAPPADVTTRYDEKAITVEWPAREVAAQPPAFHVYESGANERRLTQEPLEVARFEDTRLEWGAERCYVVRSVAMAGVLRVESAASAPACVTLRDTFAPAVPTGLQTVPEAGAVSLIWNAVDDPGLAGYLVLRAIAPATELQPLTPTPIAETTFRDVVAAGQRVTYAVQAVDKSGNASAPSERREETPR